MTSDRPIDNMTDKEIAHKRNVIFEILHHLQTANILFVENFGESIDGMDELIIDAKDSIAIATRILDERTAERSRS